MGRCKGDKIYTAKNIVTGEELTGRSKEIMNKINIPSSSLQIYAERGSVYRKTWKFSYVYINVKEKDSDEIPWEKWDEWDKERIRVKEWLQNRGKSKRRLRK